MRNKLWIAVVAILIALAAIWFWQNPPGGGPALQAIPVPAGQTVAVNPPCGTAGAREVGPFAGPGQGRPSQVLVQVVSSCDGEEAEIEIEQADGTWVPLRERWERTEGATGEKPKVNSWYVMTVPAGKKVRLSCPDGDGTCAFNVTDITVQQPNRRFSIRQGNLNPACGGALGDSRLVNLSEGPVTVVVTFTSLCTDAAGRRQAGTVQFTGVRPPPANAVNPRTRVVQPVAPPGNTQWEGPLDAGFKLEASCAGNRGNCRFTVVVKG